MIIARDVCRQTLSKDIADSDETPTSAMSDLDLQCLLTECPIKI